MILSKTYARPLRRVEGTDFEAEREPIAYALCGGMALAVHGLVRATVDIDILVPKESLAAARSVARQLGYIIEATPMRFAEGAVETHRISKADPDSGEMLSLDFLLVTEPLAKVWETREEVEWERASLWVVSRAGLLRNSAEAVRILTISNTWLRVPMKPDMSRKAIAARLRRVSQLRRLCLSLQRAKRKRSPATDSQGRQGPPKTSHF